MFVAKKGIFVLGKTFVMVLLCHSSACGCFQVHSLFCLQGLMLYFTFSVVIKRGQGSFLLRVCLARFPALASVHLCITSTSP